MEKRHKVLRTLADIFEVLTFLMVLAGILAWASLLLGRYGPAFLDAALLGGALILSALLLLSYAKLLRLLIDVEDHARDTANYFRRRNR